MTEKIEFHPEFLNSYSKWREIDDFVDGDNERVLPYLQRWASEMGNTTDAAAAFKRRQDRICNEDEVVPIREVLKGYLCQPISFGQFSAKENAKSAMARIIDDVTGFELSAQGAFAQMILHWLDHGKCGVLVDGPKDIAANRKLAEQLQERSYQCLYTALEIKSWSFFTDGPRRGQLQSILLADGVVKNGDEKRAKFLRYRYLPDNIVNYVVERLVANDPTVVENARGEFPVTVEIIGTGTLDRIPFVMVGSGLADSTLKIPTKYNKKLLNLRSEHDNIDYFQSSKRVILTGTDGSEVQTMNEQTVTCIPNENVEVHSIDPGNPESLATRIGKMEVKLRRYGMRQFHQIVSDDSAQVQSAESKSLDMTGLTVWLNETLDMFQRKLRQIYQLHGQFEGIGEDIEVTISRDFGLQDKTTVDSERGTIFSRAGSLGAREVQKQVLIQQIGEMRNIVPEQDEDIEAARERLMDDIREANPEPPTIGGSPFGQNRPSPIANL